MVYCNIKEIHWAWPLAIASSALYGVVFWNSQLYGEASLQIMFILTSTWGWQQWRTVNQATQDDNSDVPANPLRISALAPSELQKVVIAAIIAWPALTFFLDRLTDSNVAIWDALVTTLS
jgi:nicotinamide mononucleotide transporter